MERVMRFDGSECDADRFAAMYDACLTGMVLESQRPIQLRDKARTLADVRCEASIQDKLAAVSEPSDKGASSPEPMRELRAGMATTIVLTSEEHKVLVERIEAAIPRLAPSKQRGALTALEYVEAAEKVTEQAGEKSTSEAKAGNP